MATKKSSDHKLCIPDPQWEAIESVGLLLEKQGEDVRDKLHGNGISKSKVIVALIRLHTPAKPKGVF